MDEATDDVTLEPHEACAAAPSAGPRVFIDRHVLDDMNAHAAEETEHEIAGIMIGSVSEGPCPVVMVSASIRGQHLTYTRGSVTFTHDTWNELNRVKDEQYPDLRIVGWYHSHPGFGLFLSNYDLFIHKGFFTAPWQIAFVTDPKAKTYGCFTWQDGDLGQDHDFQISAATEGRYSAPLEAPSSTVSQPLITITPPSQPASRDTGMMLALWVLSGFIALVAVLAVSNYSALARLGTLPGQVRTLSAQVSALQGELATPHPQKAVLPKEEPAPTALPQGPSAPSAAPERQDNGVKSAPSGS